MSWYVAEPKCYVRFGVYCLGALQFLFRYRKTGDIDASLEYLADKEYVLKKESPPYLEQERVRRYKLTPSGVDLPEGNVDADPGILLPRG
jgi:hypothetical protein